jgi:transglutaminase-like putative cysteine protease
MVALERYLRPGVYVDSDHARVVEFAREHARGASDLERGVYLYYAVRDAVRYNPFQDFMAEASYRGSTCLERGEGWCVPKAALLAACARAAGIPARVGFADVKNHLTTPRLAEFMGTDLFIYHGYAELYLDERWVKATPAFNLALCTRFRVRPLEFDGRNDSVFHAFDEDNRRHMEYVGDRGRYADVPVEQIKQAFRDSYPSLYRLGAEATREAF